MSLRLKLVLSYILMGVLPIFLFICALAISFVMMIGQSGLFGSSDNSGATNLFESGSYLAKMERRLSENPTQTFTAAELDQLDAALKPFNGSYALLDPNGEILYRSARLGKSTLEGMLADIQSGKVTANAASHRSTSSDFSQWNSYGFRKNNLPVTLLIRELDGGKQGRICVLVDMSPVGAMMSRYLGTSMRVVLVVLVLIIAALTWLVSRSLLRSLGQLRTGVGNIAEGNLDVELQAKGHDEVADVVRAFEQMRRRLKQSIQEQLKYEEDRKELVTSISHDLKTPITAIKGYVEGLMDGVADTPDKQEHYLRTIHNKSMVMDRMIDDLFLFSKLDLGRLNYHFEVTDANRFAADLLEETQLDMEGRGFTVETALNLQEGTQLWVDRMMIRRVQQNLNENAVKYCTGDKRHLQVSCRQEGARILFITRDNGKGIPESELPHVFERFYRSDAARSSETGGVGLGLQIARQVVEGHGGTISATSRETEFTEIVYALPVYAAQGTPTGEGR